MFSYLRSLVVEYHSKPAVSFLTLAVALLICSVLLVSAVQWLKRRRQHQPTHWTSLITGSLSNVLKTLIGIVVLVVLCLYMRYESSEFSRKQGGMSDRNYQAVQMIWGRPHVQNELSARLYTTTTKYYDKDGLEFDAEKLKNSEKLIAYNERTVQQTLTGNWIRKANHQIDLTMNYRTKGGASYPGFEVDCVFRYALTNSSKKDADASIQFPMPQRQGLVDHLKFLVDGKDITPLVSISSSSISYPCSLKSGQSIQVEIQYHSRGLGHIQILPGSSHKLDSYELTMNCRGVDGSRIDYPVGCMTPSVKSQAGDDLLLQWSLKDAVTRFGMGAILPKRKAPSANAASMLKAAPWGLLLLVGMVLSTHLLTRRPIAYALLLVLSLTYVAAHLLMANIGDYAPGVLGGLIIAGAVLTSLTGVLWLRRTDRLMAISTIVFFVIFTIGWPFISVQNTGDLLKSILYVLLLGWIVYLLVRQRNVLPEE